jgi:DNA-binding CsgD family transcriptional regulator
MDAAAVLQLCRAELANAVTAGPVPGAEIRARGGPEDVNRWMLNESHQWRELLSTRPFGFPEHLRISLPNNRAALDNGLRMTSVFDHNGLREEGRALLAAERQGTYLISACPVQMNIVDRRFALLQGPSIGDEFTVMAVDEPRCMAAAWTYWHRVLELAYPVADHPRGDGPLLSPRQRQIMSLLSSDTSDEAIASALEISVRTVRSDIAQVMRTLGVRSRFAAGVRLRDIAEQGTADPA